LPAAGWALDSPRHQSAAKEMLAVVVSRRSNMSAESAWPRHPSTSYRHRPAAKFIEDHFDASPFLEDFLEKSTAKKASKPSWCETSQTWCSVSYTRQKSHSASARRSGRARLVGDEPFAVLLGDVLIPGENPATKQLIEVYEATGVGAIA